MTISEQLQTEIAKRTFVSIGTNMPWQRFFAKESLHLAFLGGSITQGYADHQVYARPYPLLVQEHLAAQGKTVTICNCAEPGMDTMIANALIERWIRPNVPDLVFVEFAINETNLRPSVVSFESMLRKLLSLPEPPIVCLFLLRNVRGYSCESYMRPIAEHYGLPCISLQQGLDAYLQDGSLQWSDFADADSHPHPEGHQLLAACINHLLTTAQSEETPVSPTVFPPPWLDAPYAGLRLLDASDNDAVTTTFSLESRVEGFFPQAWVGEQADAVWSVRVYCRMLLLFFEAHTLHDYGDCEVTLDDAPANPPVLHSQSIYAWGNPRHAMLLDDETAAWHTISLRPQNGKWVLFGIGYCE